MVDIKISYEGELHCDATHGPSGSRLQTDAPIDNRGRGETFSPTDLVATAAGTCMATIMGIYADRHAIDLTGMTVSVQKTMRTEPRRIAKLTAVFEMPKALEERHRQGLRNAALSCPVHQSIHPDVETPVEFHWPE